MLERKSVKESKEKKEKKEKKDKKKEKNSLYVGQPSDAYVGDTTPGFADLYGGGDPSVAPSPMGINMNNASGMGMQSHGSAGFAPGPMNTPNSQPNNKFVAPPANLGGGYYEQSYIQKIAGGISIVLASAALATIVTYVTTDKYEEGYPCPGIGLSWEESDCSKKHYIDSEGFMLSNSHPVFMTTGTIFCGIFGANAWGLLEGLIVKTAPAQAHNIAKAIHVCSFTGMFVFIGMGLFAISSKNCANEEGDEGCHFGIYQLHHWVGITVVTVLCLQFLFGLSSFIVSAANRERLAMYHRAIGAIALMMSCVAVLTGTEMYSFFMCHPSPSDVETLADTRGTTYLRVSNACKSLNTFGLLVIFAVAMALFAAYPLVNRMKRV